MSSNVGFFYGVGVGPGEPGLMPVVAWQALQTCDVILAPRAQSSKASIARRCLDGLDVQEERIREVEFKSTSGRSALHAHYREVAQQIAVDLKAGKNVAYLTIGDPFTYSTYGYALAALKNILPELSHRTFPGVTSYAAAAAALDWPLGEGKERVLVAPCPEEMGELEEDIHCHDIVVLMKIGERLPEVLGLLRKMKIEEHCSLASHVGMSEEKLFRNAAQAGSDGSVGFLSTMLIRKDSREKRPGGSRAAS